MTTEPGDECGTSGGQYRLFDDDAHHPTRVLSYGLGLDSTAILLRWLHEPATRDFDLNELVVITAHTGDEFASTARDVEEAVLPGLRRHRVRYVQVGRRQLHTSAAGDGITIFSDTTKPHTLHIGGDYRLSDEMLSAGTLPQLGGARRCSARAKGAALDPVIAKLTAGRPYRHYIGFEANEQARAAKDTPGTTPTCAAVSTLLSNRAGPVSTALTMCRV